MITMHVYSDGSYYKDERLTLNVLPSNYKELPYIDMNKTGAVTHGGFVAYDDNGTLLMAMRINCTIPQFVREWNIGGEVVGAMLGVDWCSQYIKAYIEANGHDDSKIVVYHDYMGISEWIKPHGRVKWKTKPNTCGEYYVRKMNSIFNTSTIGLEFIKVKAHTGIKGNVAADAVAGGDFSNMALDGIGVEVINV